MCVDDGGVGAEVRGEEVGLVVGPGVVVEARLAEGHPLVARRQGGQAFATLFEDGKCSDMTSGSAVRRAEHQKDVQGDNLGE